MILCVAAIAITLIELLMPSGKMEKTVRFALGAFMICMVASPLLSLFNDIDFNFESSEDVALNIDESISSDTYELAKDNIESLVTTLLSQNGISPKKVEVSMDINEDTGIDISKIIIYLDKGQEALAQEAKSLCENNFSIETEVILM